jgi:hypothetical protein
MWAGQRLSEATSCGRLCCVAVAEKPYTEPFPASPQDTPTGPCADKLARLPHYLPTRRPASPAAASAADLAVTCRML